MSFLWSLIWGNVVTRCITVALAALFAIKGYGLHEKYKGRSEGKTAVIEASKAEGKKLNVESKKARDAVDANFDRLLKQYCRDCK